MDDNKILEQYYEKQLELEKQQKEAIKKEELRRRKLLKKNSRGQYVPIDITDEEFETLISKPHIDTYQSNNNFKLLTGIFSATAVFSLLMGILIAFEAANLNFDVGHVLASFGLFLVTILLVSLSLVTDYLGKKKK